MLGSAVSAGGYMVSLLGTFISPLQIIHQTLDAPIQDMGINHGDFRILGFYGSYASAPHVPYGLALRKYSLRQG
jgi:hypothetical protein